MFAPGDRVFPLDDLGGGVWSRVGTVVAVGYLPDRPDARGDRDVRVTGGRPEANRLPPPAALATVLWDDGQHETLGEDRLCLVYGHAEPVGIQVTAVHMIEPFDVVERAGHVILLVREGLLEPGELAGLREKLRRVRARVERAPESLSPAERRVRELGMLRALVAQLTAEG
ncbi:MAG: hypothetical protein ACQSGP_30150 [Frankia sp.]